MKYIENLLAGPAYPVAPDDQQSGKGTGMEAVADISAARRQ